MEEIKVGEFIRTKGGYVGKVLRLGDEFPYNCIYECGGYKIDIGFHNIVKHSSNIIDLIEVGDYVNGYKVRATYLEGERQYIKFEKLNDIRMYEKDIKSIVTKEQFETMKYEVI